jgi:two-component system, OmpR family, sensor histidine kinase KdpD
MARGSLRIYLGASPGVGKTYKMLGEGVRRKDRGADVVIGVVETHSRGATAEQIGDLEIVPMRDVAYRGTTLKEMDVEALVRRRPQIVLVDEYAHTNAPGSPNEKRWQDVEQLLAAGIDVIATLNIQHLESLNDVITRITGIVQRETVPDDIVRRADQLELVDMTPEAIRRRLAHGNIYPAERIDAAMSNYFRPGNLSALRELALLWVADRVEDSLQGYLQAHGISDSWETRERVVVGITGRPGGESLIRRASRMAGRISGDLLGVHVVVDDGLSRTDPSALAAQRKLVSELGGTVHDVVGQDTAEALVAFARREKATQLVLGATLRTRWQEILRGSLVARVTRLAGTIDVHVIHNEDDESDNDSRGGRRAARQSVTNRRRLAALALTVIGLPALIAATLPLRDHVALSTELLLVLSLVLAIAALGGTIVGAAAAVFASLLVNWYFVPPYNTLTIAEVENVIALIVFVGVAVTVGSLVVATSRRSVEAKRARVEAEALARSATSLAADPDPLPALLDNVRTTFSLLGVRITDEHSHATTAQAGDVSGAPFAAMPLHTSMESEQLALEVYGSLPSNDDYQLLRILADQLAVALDKRFLAAEAAEADKLADIDAVRTALLRAVSHDLRTPLASIKAMISGLRDRSVPWKPEEVDEAHATIEEETDRLNRLVGNLLDASRLQIGALAVDIRPTDIGAVIASAVQSVNPPAHTVSVDAADRAITALADATLLERSLDNLLNNAVRHSRAGCPVVVDSAVISGRVHIRIVDRGPGVPTADRTKVVQPFQRLGDQNTSDGVGLGLAITQGFVDAMHGTLSLDDTPGGGLTATITLPLAEGLAA